MVVCKRADTLGCVGLGQANDMADCKRVHTRSVGLDRAGNKTCARNLELGNRFWGSLCFVECCVGVLDNKLASHYLKHVIINIEKCLFFYIFVLVLLSVQE